MQRKLSLGGIFLLFLLLCTIISYIHLDTISSTEDPTSWAEETLSCTAIIDGDTFILETGETVRLIGIDAPELFQPRFNLRWEEDIPIIDWSDAHKYYNQYVIVEGTIVNTFNSGNVCFLNFHTDYDYFTAVIFASDFLGFPMPPEIFYLGKMVQIIGIIQQYNGSPEIIVKTPDQIRIID